MFYKQYSKRYRQRIFFLIAERYQATNSRIATITKPDKDIEN